MSIYRLKNVLSPRSVALVGASPRRVSVGRAILENIRKAKFRGELGLVNPHYAEIDGIRCVASLSKLPFVPELVVITAPVPTIVELVDEAGRLGAAGVLIITAGLGHGAGSLAQAAEWAAHGIQANAIGPGYIVTDMNRTLAEDAKFDAWVRGRTPSGRWGVPDDLIGVAVFLASAASAYVNGQIIYVDGGLLAVL